MNNITIKTPKGKRMIGPGHPVFIVAEISANHKQSYKRALKIIDAAIDAGVDAIKLQTYTPDTLTIKSDKKWFRINQNSIWAGQTLYNLYKKAYTPWDWQPQLKKYVEKKGVIFFSTPFDNTAVDFLEKINVPCYKVSSFDVINIELLKKIAKTKKPVIMSRGMASMQEIKSAIKTLKDNGTPQIAVLHCISSYPAKPEEMNLATIPDIKKRFKVTAGLSDHTLTISTAIASVVLGACIIEKHLTLKRADGGPDATFSLEPKEFKELIKSIRQVEKAIGKVQYGSSQRESENIVFRKSLFAVANIKKGEKFTEKNIRSIRPGYGSAPKYLNKIINKIATKDIKKGTPLCWKMIK